MNALRKIQVVAHAPATVATAVGPPAPRLRVVARKPVEALAAPEAGGNAARNISLFLLAPFIGLAYVVILPFAGLAALAWIGGRAAVGRTGRNLR